MVRRGIFTTRSSGSVKTGCLSERRVLTPERLQRIRAVLARRQPDLTVIADEVHKGRNIAAILRTCDAVGIDTLYSVVPEAGYRPYRGTALGTQKWVSVEVCDSLIEPVTALKARGFQVVVTALSAAAVDFRAVDYTKPTALVLGSERAGASEIALSQADYSVTIPMVGMVESLNVSVAGAVILAEIQRQRADAGLYDHCRLPVDVYQRRFFQWAHPQVAAYCDREDLVYPAVGEDGEITQPAQWYRAVRGCSRVD